MKARLECGAAALSIVIENGIIYGQNEIASVPKAAEKITATKREAIFVILREPLEHSCEVVEHLDVSGRVGDGFRKPVVSCPLAKISRRDSSWWFCGLHGCAPF